MTLPDPARALAALRAGRRRARQLRILAILFVAAAFGAVVWAALSVPAPTPVIVDPALERLGLSDGSGGSQLHPWLGAVVAVLLVAATVIAVRWVATARDGLEALLGAPIDRARPGPAGRLAARRWRPLFTAVGPDLPAWWPQHRSGSGRRAALLAIAPALIGLPLLLAGLGLGLAGPANDGRQLAATLQVSGAVLVGVSAALVVPVLVGIRRREVIALRNIGDDTAAVPRALPLPTVAVGLPIAFALGMSLAVPPDSEACEIEGARCVEIIVPADRDAPTIGETMTVRYAIYESRREDARLLVVAVGGPGASGIDEAPYLLESFGSEVRGAFDVAFFDQRGVGASGGRDCPDAALAWDRAPVAEWTAARDFVRDCVDETGVEPADLPRYRTEQVVGDIEALRSHLGHEQISLYGQSYGTELAQAYAIAHPDRVEALVLDGPVDLGQTPHEFWLAAARGFGASLEAAFAECSADEWCADDLPDPQATYEAVVERLEDRPVEVELDTGFLGGRVTVTGPTFEGAVGSAMYTSAGRSVVLRALAEARRDQWDYVARFAGDTPTVWDPGGVSTFAYYAVSCGDEPFTARAGDGSEFTTGAEQAAAAYAEQARRAGIDDELLGSAYYAGMPCVHWPAEPDPGIPALTDAAFPVLVLTATADPITPAAGGRAIVERQPEGYLVETRGGSHVTFGWGDPCVDDVVVGLLVRGDRPPARTTCDGFVTDGYWPVTPLDADDFEDPLLAATSFETELLAAPEFHYWDGSEDLEFDCRLGGSVEMDYDGSQFRLTMSDCEWAEGLAVDATGRVDPETLDTRLDIVGEGIDARYVSTAEEWSLTGTWDGEEVSIEG